MEAALDRDVERVSSASGCRTLTTGTVAAGSGRLTPRRDPRTASVPKPSRPQSLYSALILSKSLEHRKYRSGQWRVPAGVP